MRRLERSRRRLRVWALGVAGMLAGGCGGAPAPSDRGMGGTGSGGAVASGAGGAAGGNVGASGGGGASVGGAGGSGGLPSAGAGGAAGGVAGMHGSAGGAGGIAGTRGDPGLGGSFTGSAGSGASGGSIGSGGAGIGGSTAGSGGGAAGSAGNAGSGGGNDCSLPATVSFQKDVQPFLITTCGGGNGCHVIDAASTVANGGYDHAYDWITAGAHPSSCPNTLTPKRFEVVIAVIDAADPPSCSKSRMMPPQDETGANLRMPLTVCQIATLQAWLDEPLVTQMHRVDDTDPVGTAPFPMPPFN